MKKAKLLTILATVIVGLGAASCAMPDFLYVTVEGHQHTIVHYYNEYHHWDECTECGERFNIEDHTYGEMTKTETNHMATCTVCGYGLNEAHKFEYIDNQDGTHTSICSVCSYDGGTEDHTFVATATEMVIINEESGVEELHYGHILTCVCGATSGDFEDHYSEDEGYYADNESHYHICDVCGCSYDKEAHNPEEQDEYSYTKGIYTEEDGSEYYGYCIVTYQCSECGKEYKVTYEFGEDDYLDIFGE